MKISKKKCMERKSLVKAPRTKEVKAPSQFLPCHGMKLRSRASVSGSFSQLPKEMLENILKLVTSRELALVEACSSYFREQTREVWKKKAKVSVSEEFSKVKIRVDRLAEEFKKQANENSRLLNYQIPDMDDINQACTKTEQLRKDSLQVILKLKRAVKLEKLVADRSWKEVLKILA